MRHKDPDRKAVYLSEEVAFAGTLAEEPLQIDNLLQLADELFNHDWWQKCRLPTPEIESTRWWEWSSYAEVRCNSSVSIIRLRPADYTPWFLAHEAAHIAQFNLFPEGLHPDLEGHGREFRKCALIVTEILLGRAARRELWANYERRLPDQTGSVSAVPVLDQFVDPDGVGIFMRWRIQRLREEEAAYRRLHGSERRPSTTRIGGAISL